MFSVIRNGIGIAIDSLRFIKNNKTILLIDLMADLALIFWTAAILLPVYFMEDFFFGEETPAFILIIGVIIFYFGAVFIYMFFQAMILSFTFNSFKGRRVNWSSSFRQAAGKWFGILCWSFVDGTVGLFLGKSRRGRNRFSTFALSGIWKILTIMVLPVILFEDVGLKGTVKRATGLFRASWGENISGNMGIGVFVFAATLAMIAVVTVIAFFLKAGEIFTMDQMEPFFMGVFYVYGVFLAILTSSIHAVFEASIYYYSLEKEEPGVYKRGLMDSAIKGY